MSKPTYVRFFPSDWLAGTRGLSAAETGVYITLIAMMYESGGAIRRDDARLARLCGCPLNRFKAALGVLIDQGKIEDDDGELSNQRTRQELSWYSKRTQTATKNAHRRWQKTEENQSADDAGASDWQCGRNAKPEARSQKPERREAAAAVGAYPARGESSKDAAAEPSTKAVDRLMEAAGHDPAKRVPIGWIDHAVIEALDRWRALGLHDSEILDVVARRTPARGSSREPPSVPAYFDRPMRDAAERKRRGHDPASDQRLSAFGRAETVE